MNSTTYLGQTAIGDYAADDRTVRRRTGLCHISSVLISRVNQSLVGRGEILLCWLRHWGRFSSKINSDRGHAKMGTRLLNTRNRMLRPFITYTAMS